MSRWYFGSETIREDIRQCIAVQLNEANHLACRDDLVLAQQEEYNEALNAASVEEAMDCEDAAIF
jgi:hypothetical protein